MKQSKILHFVVLLQVENAKVYSAPYVLCQPLPLPPVDTGDETAASLLASAQNASVLYCGYCLSHDDKYLLAVCTDSVGELIESSLISVDPPLRPDGRPRKTAARTKALTKLWEFCQGVIATSLIPWRLVITKLGRIGPEELKGKQNMSIFSQICTLSFAVLIVIIFILFVEFMGHFFCLTLYSSFNF